MLKSFVAISFLLVNSVASSATLFSDNFENDLSLWNDAYQGNNAQIVNDPLNSGNHVLNFTALRGGGDLFTASGFSGDTGGSYILSFDYLGTCGHANCGGFIGYSSNTTGGHQTWLGGTTAPYRDLLPDTGSWEHVSIAFNTSLNSVHLMLEDWSGSGGVAGDAYFDNILLTDANGPTSVSEPMSIVLLGLGVAGMSLTRKKHIA